jgi:hypothetical protein
MSVLSIRSTENSAQSTVCTNLQQEPCQLIPDYGVPIALCYFSISTACSSVVPGGTSVKSDFTSSSCCPIVLKNSA